MRATRRFTVRTVLPRSLEGLDRLARNLRWTWHPPTRALFERLVPDAPVGSSPLQRLARLGPERLRELAADDDVVRQVRAAEEDLEDYLGEHRWYQMLGRSGDLGPLPEAVAHVSEEYGLAASWPQYSGGQGVLAGDHLKAASDLGVPVVGVGLLYTAGHPVQRLTAAGRQVDDHPAVDPATLPVLPVRREDGQPLEVEVELPGAGAVRARVLRVDVGRVPLLLLDTDVPGAGERARSLTGRVLPADDAERLARTVLLGVGGVRALRAWCALARVPDPDVVHVHGASASTVALELLRERLVAGSSLAAAVEQVRAAVVLTTHTQRFAVGPSLDAGLVAEHVRAVTGEEDVAEGVVRLGTRADGDFAATAFALSLAGRVVGVSRAHARHLRAELAPWWPQLEEDDVPVGWVTNGVHAPSWTDERVLRLAGERLDGREVADGSGWERADGVSDVELWEVRRALREELVLEARRRLRHSARARGASEAGSGWIDQALAPDVLTVGLAGRIQADTRPALLLADEERLRALLLHPDHPVQVVVAGTVHAGDERGQELLEQLVTFADQEDVRHRFVFVPEHDIDLGRIMCAGADVWLSTTRPRTEACGTSGMKAVLNGGLVVAPRSGWWAETADARAGWVLPSAVEESRADREDGRDREDAEAAEARALVDLLAGAAQEFVDRDGRGLSPRWLARVRRSLATVAPRVQATRMVAEYVEELYVPAARTVAALADPAEASALGRWRRLVHDTWRHVRIEDLRVTAADGTPAPADLALGSPITVSVELDLGPLRPEDVAVDVLHGCVDGDELVDREATAAAHDGATWSAVIRLDRSGPFGCAVRVRPAHPLLPSPADTGLQLVG